MLKTCLDQAPFVEFVMIIVFFFGGGGFLRKIFGTYNRATHLPPLGVLTSSTSHLVQ